MAKPINISQQQIETLKDELNINTTELLIGDWEESVGLPDDCFPNTGTIEQRRLNVITRIRKKPVVTLADMQAYVEQFVTDIDVALSPGQPYFSLPYKLPQKLLGNVSARFILVAEIEAASSELPYQLPQQLNRGADLSVLRCVLEKVIPANVVLAIVERV